MDCDLADSSTRRSISLKCDWQPLPNISAARNAQLQAAKMAFFADLQTQFDALPGGRNIILNGVDTVETAALFNPTGASGVMIDHWSILQFLVTGEPMDAGTCSVTPPTSAARSTRPPWTRS